MALLANNNQQQADGGYWYLVNVVTDSEGNASPDVPANTSFCAWYGIVGGVRYAAVRCIAAVSMPDVVTVVDFRQFLAAAGYIGEPYGRIGGV